MVDKTSSGLGLFQDLTPRLVIRHFSKNDLEDLAALLADPEVMRFSSSGPLTKNQVEGYLRNRLLNSYAQDGFGLYALVHKKDQCFIGYAGLLLQLIDGEKKVELGYRLMPNYWGQGFATEAALAVCNYAFDTLHLEELISIIESKNVRSVNLAKRIGMQYWKSAVFHNLPVDIYSIKKAAANLN